jgi:hypothetical protein
MTLPTPRAVALALHTRLARLSPMAKFGALSGQAGGSGTTTLGDVYWHVNRKAILIILLGGLETFCGPIVHAFAVVMRQNYRAQFGAMVTIIQGLTFVIFVIMLRCGVGGELGPIAKRLFPRGHLLRQAQASARRIADCHRIKASNTDHRTRRNVCPI